jgi:hypothetical protein
MKLCLSSVGWNPAIAPYRVLCWSPTASCRTCLSPKVSVPVTASLLTQGTRKTPPQITVGVRRYRKREIDHGFCSCGQPEQCTNHRGTTNPIRGKSAGNPPPRVAQKGAKREDNSWRDEKRQRSNQRQKTENQEAVEKEDCRSRTTNK